MGEGPGVVSAGCASGFFALASMAPGATDLAAKRMQPSIGEGWYIRAPRMERTKR